MNSINPTTVDLTSDEITVLTALMGDIQVAAAAFYAKTATSAAVESLGTEVRTFLSAAQTLNERLSGSITEKEAYRSALLRTDIGHGYLLRACMKVLPFLSRPQDPIQGC